MDKAGKFWTVGNTIQHRGASKDLPFSGGLYTERLRLRRLIERDAPIIQHMVSNWEVAKQTMSLPNPYTLDHAAEFIQSAETEWQDGTHFVLGLERQRDGVLIGTVSATVERKLWGQEAEIGYWIGEEFWGQGFTTEALDAFLSYCRKTLKLRRLKARVFAENEASLRLLAGQGFREKGRSSEHLPERGGKRTILHLHCRLK